jgi:hypothetical protein
MAEGFPQVPQGVEGRHDHRPNGEGTDLSEPDRGGEVREAVLGTHEGGQPRIQEDGEGHQEEPPHDGAGEEDRCNPGTDDVAHPHEHGRGARRRTQQPSAVLHSPLENVDGRAPKGEEPAGAILNDLDPVEVLQELPQPCQTHGSEKVGRPGLASLPGLHDLGRGDTLRKGKISLHDQGPSEHNDEEDPQDATDDHDRRTLQVAEILPRPTDDEGGNREDGAGYQPLPHRGRGPRDVLLQDGSPEEPEHRHGHHRCGEGRGHRQPRRHADVGVGRTEDDGHESAQNQGLEGQLVHGAGCRHEWDEGLLVHRSAHGWRRDRRHRVGGGICPLRAGRRRSR